MPYNEVNSTRNGKECDQHTQQARLVAVWVHSSSASSAVKVVVGAAPDDVEEAWRFIAGEQAT